MTCATDSGPSPVTGRSFTSTSLSPNFSHPDASAASFAPLGPRTNPSTDSDSLSCRPSAPTVVNSTSNIAWCPAAAAAAAAPGTAAARAAKASINTSTDAPGASGGRAPCPDASSDDTAAQQHSTPSTTARDTWRMQPVRSHTQRDPDRVLRVWLVLL